MQTRYSSTLRDILECRKRQSSDKNYCAAESVLSDILGVPDCHASFILNKLLDQQAVDRFKSDLDDHIAQAHEKDMPSDDDFFATLMPKVVRSCGENLRLDPATISNPDVESLRVINTGHYLLWCVLRRSGFSSNCMDRAGLTRNNITQWLADLPSDENYYDHIKALESQATTQNASASGDDNDKQRYYFIEIPSLEKRQEKKGIAAFGKFGADLTLAARKGEIDPVIGRDTQIDRLIQILGRRKKNNPVLIGEAGVGKSAIVEGLALRIAQGRVPESLHGKTVFSLDLTSLVAGTKFRGEFEERIKAMLDELTSSRDVILFIDEIHTIVGAGSTQGSLDTANILKPALARGELQCIGATTLDEYRQTIENDAALERRFQKIIVEPTTEAQTLEILQNIKSHYETHHTVRYTPDALKACVELTGRYLTDRQFPDKAIDALDEAGSRAHSAQTDSELIAGLESMIADTVGERHNALTAHDYSKAAESRIREVALRERLAESRAEYHREQKLNPPVVTVENIEQVITSMTGIPVEKVSVDERQRLRDMNDYLCRRVIGQDQAVAKVTKSIRRSRCGLKDPGKPIGVFMFVGPTGVGKTHLAKELSTWLFDKPEALIRIDMSEYSEKHNVSRLIGSPPGYVGYGEGGQLTESIRRQPYAVVLFDEIEKAHPEVFNLMLQIFDEGQLTDGLGRKVDFRNTVIIMTSNVGSRRVAERGQSIGFTKSETTLQDDLKSRYRQALESTFAPEFINRIDDIVTFNTLSQSDIEQIVEMQLATLCTRASSLGYTLRITPEARCKLALKGYDARYGVRSLKRAILESVEEPLATMIIEGQLSENDTIEIGCANEELELQKIAA